MAGIIKTEFLKLKRYFIVWIGVALMLLTILLTLFTSMAEDGSVWDFQVLLEQVIKNFVTLIFPMCITLITGYMIARETTDDTLKNIVTIPISFPKLLIGKLMVAGMIAIFLGIVCYLFTVIASFIAGYDGFSIQASIIEAGKMAFLALSVYIAVLPVIIFTSRLHSGFLAGVIISLVYGFVGMFMKGSLVNIYPTSAALGLIQYRSYDAGVHWNVPLCALSILLMLVISVCLILLQRQGDLQKQIIKKQPAVLKKGW